jgi:hypothetical protein
MAARIFEKAWSGNISEIGQRQAFQLMPSKGNHFCNANMPIVRIVPAISRLQYDLYAETMGRSNRWNSKMTDDPSTPAGPASVAERKPLTPAAKRALAEAEARRQAAEANAKPAAKEFQGPKGPEPTRYGDWETKGIASDF